MRGNLLVEMVFHSRIRIRCLAKFEQKAKNVQKETAASATLSVKYTAPLWAISADHSKKYTFKLSSLGDAKILGPHIYQV